jgi:hypothetical protein
VLLKSDGSSERGCIAKVADFGLAVKMDHQDTHVSAFQVGGTVFCFSGGWHSPIRSTAGAAAALHPVLSMLVSTCTHTSLRSRWVALPSRSTAGAPAALHLD